MEGKISRGQEKEKKWQQCSKSGCKVVKKLDIIEIIKGAAADVNTNQMRK